MRHTPAEKLYDAFLAILSGAHGLSEINTRLRADATLQRSFGRATCAEYSLVRDTLDACTAQNVEQLRRVVGINRRRKKRAAARAILTLLGTLAHNVLVWARGWLSLSEPRLKQYGVVRFLRDVLCVSGSIETD